MASPSRHYTELATAPIVTAPIVHRMAQASLRALASHGAREDGGPMPGDVTWVQTSRTQHGANLHICCSGPYLPRGVPNETIRPADVGKNIRWAGTWRLVIRAPLTVLDLYWREEDSLRILQFSRGDWEQDVLGL